MFDSKSKKIVVTFEYEEPGPVTCRISWPEAKSEADFNAVCTKVINVISFLQNGHGLLPAKMAVAAAGERDKQQRAAYAIFNALDSLHDEPEEDPNEPVVPPLNVFSPPEKE